MNAPFITIFVRHAPGCKYAGDEFSKRCQCRKHLRWTLNGKQYRRQAGTRSWADAEQAKRDVEDQLSGKPVELKPEAPRLVDESVRLFMVDKSVQGVGASCLSMYKRDLENLSTYCTGQGVITVQGITRELMAGYCVTWGTDPATSQTRASRRARVGAFLRFCFESGWINRVPSLPRIQIESAPTMPLTPDEYARLLESVSVANAKDTAVQKQCRALFLLMRHSGLAIRDALTLERAEILQDAGAGRFRVVTARQKTGTHVSVPLQPAIAREILDAPTPDPKYLFWDGKTPEYIFAVSWGQRVARVFEAAGIPDVCHMKSHRLRDTFAVDLLEKGVPLEEVSKLLGHESIRTTEKHYAKWVKGRQDRLDALVTGTWAA
ncbi:MAG: tyrosine-type recombinase/integrase [Terracidiphilus sp.]